eukprot:4308125-Pyramimonas_sp.AAC.1
MATSSRMEGGWFSECRSGLSAARIRFKPSRKFDGLRAAASQNGLSPYHGQRIRTYVLEGFRIMRAQQSC